jgi:hypothetical protein
MVSESQRDWYTQEESETARSRTRKMVLYLAEPGAGSAL